MESKKAHKKATKTAKHLHHIGIAASAIEKKVERGGTSQRPFFSKHPLGPRGATHSPPRWEGRGRDIRIAMPFHRLDSSEAADRSRLSATQTLIRLLLAFFAMVTPFWRDTGFVKQKGVVCSPV